MKVKVRTGTQIKHDGKLYSGGSTFDAPERLAQSWLRAGYAEKVAERKTTKQDSSKKSSSK